MILDWTKRRAKYFDDGFHNTDYAPHPFPDYIKNPSNPFTVCTAVHSETDKWCGTDSIEKYEQNLLTKPDNWHYRTKDVSYKTN